MNSLQSLVPVGKLVRPVNASVILDISEDNGSLDINKVYRLDGEAVQDGQQVDGVVVDEAFMDALCDEIRRGKYTELQG